MVALAPGQIGPRTELVLHALEAAAAFGRPCPTNVDLLRLLPHATDPNTITFHLDRLEAVGMIRRTTRGGSRFIYVATIGKHTGWTQARDRWATRTRTRRSALVVEHHVLR